MPCEFTAHCVSYVAFFKLSIFTNEKENLILATTNRFNFQIMISLKETTGVVLARLARVLERRNKCSEMPLVGKRDIIDLRIGFSAFPANRERHQEVT